MNECLHIYLSGIHNLHLLLDEAHSQLPRDHEASERVQVLVPAPGAPLLALEPVNVVR